MAYKRREKRSTRIRGDMKRSGDGETEEKIRNKRRKERYENKK